MITRAVNIVFLILLGLVVWAPLAMAENEKTKDSENAPIALESSKGTPVVEPNGTIYVPSFALPESSFLSVESREALKRYREIYAKEIAAVNEVCPPLLGSDKDGIPAIRQCLADEFYQTTYYKNIRKRYNVVITPAVIGGVYVENFTPAEEVSEKKSTTDTD